MSTILVFGLVTYFSIPSVLSVSSSNVTYYNSHIMVNNTAHKVIYSGIVNVANLPSEKQIPSNNVIPPHHPRNSIAYANWQKMLESGHVPKDLIARVPETPIANITKNPYVDPLQISNSGFTGFEENNTNNLVVPDIQIGVGPNHVMEMVNLEGGVWTKQGTIVKQFRLSSFFALGNSSHTISDPRVLYDSQSGKWFSELIDQTNSTASIAVSKTNDPSGNWTLYKIPYSSPCIDFPKIGTSNDKFAISTNDFGSHCGLFTESEIIVLNKNQLINHNLPITSSDVTDSTEFSVTPAKSLSSTNPLFMIANDPTGTSNNITIYKLAGSAGSIVVSTNSTTTATTQSDPPEVPQPGTTAKLNTGFLQNLDAAWFNGKLWSAFTDSCRPSQGFANRIYSCVHMINYNTNPGNGIDFEITNSNYNFSYPALSIDNAGGMVVAFSYVSTTLYPGIYATGQTQYDPSNSVEPLVQIQSSSNYDSSCRYGDYFGAALDPSQPLIVWVAGEYHHLTNTGSTQCFGGTITSSPFWSTYIASASLWCIPPISGDWTITSTCTLGSNVNPPGNVFVTNNSVLTIPNGMTLGIDFASKKLSISSGSGVLIKPGGKIT